MIGAASVGTVFEWYDFYLVRLARHLHHQALLLGRQRDDRLHLRPAGLRRRLRGAAVRSAGVRPPGRPLGPQEHLPRDHAADGPVDLRGRPAAQLRQHRHRRADRPGGDAPGPGPGPGRRVRRAATYARRARPARKARLLHQLHPGHGHLRPVPQPGGDPADPQRGGRGRLPGLWLAHPIPDLGAAAGRVAVDPPAAVRKPVVPEDGRRGQGQQEAAGRPRSPSGAT